MIIGARREAWATAEGQGVVVGEKCRGHGEGLVVAPCKAKEKGGSLPCKGLYLVEAQVVKSRQPGGAQHLFECLFGRPQQGQVGLRRQ